MSRTVPVFWLLLPALMALAGCSTKFERDWKTAAVRPQSDVYAGRWDGQWRSAKHRNAGGRLRGILTPVTASRYRADFKADWMIFTSTYSVDFEVQRKKGEISFRGSKNLGAIFGGVYTFEGRATPDHFSSSYDSSYDTGTFEMRRPVEIRP